MGDCNIPFVPGYNPNTPGNIQLDTGAVFKNFVVGTDTVASARAAGKLIGATQGGVAINLVPDMRQIQVDGSKGAGKGLEVMNFFTGEITANFIEMSTETLQLALGARTVDTTSNELFDIIQPVQYICDDDYETNIVWVGTIKGTQDPMYIELKNVLGTGGVVFSPSDNTEGVLPVTFRAHYDPDSPEDVPITLYRPKQYGTVTGYVSTGAAAQGTLTLDTLPTAGDTMTIGATTYTFEAGTTPSAVGKIPLGAGLAYCQDNIVAAINGTDNVNTANAYVTIADFATDAAILTAIVPGTNGNTIVTTETFTAATNIFDGPTLGTTTAGSGTIQAGATISITISTRTFTVTTNSSGYFTISVPLGIRDFTATKDALTGTSGDVSVLGGKTVTAGVIIVS